MNVDKKYGVIFDMDGVLVDSNAAHFAAFKRMGELLGVPFTNELFQKTFGMHNNQIMPLWLGSGLTQKQIDEYGIKKEAIYRDLAREHLKPVPGAVALVHAVRAAGFKTSVGSSGPRENVALALSTLKIEDCFDALVTGSDITQGKPNPEVFLKAAAKLALEPRRCLVIEDAPGGVRAALNAQMPVVAIPTSRPKADLAHATFVVDTLTQLDPNQIKHLLEASSTE